MTRRRTPAGQPDPWFRQSDLQPTRSSQAPVAKPAQATPVPSPTGSPFACRRLILPAPAEGVTRSLREAGIGFEVETIETDPAPEQSDPAVFNRPESAEPILDPSSCHWHEPSPGSAGDGDVVVSLAATAALIWLALYYLPVGGALLFRLALPLPLALLLLRRGGKAPESRGAVGGSAAGRPDGACARTVDPVPLLLSVALAGVVLVASTQLVDRLGHGALMARPAFWCGWWRSPFWWENLWLVITRAGDNMLNGLIGVINNACWTCRCGCPSPRIWNCWCS